MDEIPYREFCSSTLKIQSEIVYPLWQEVIQFKIHSFVLESSDAFGNVFSTRRCANDERIAQRKVLLFSQRETLREREVCLRHAVRVRQRHSFSTRRYA
ncbi:hypothetical protein [Nostoc sp.]|uniref:hypothetical protein n=1 Tax=Nostoc sp. TaxID=1180 RepID=UPI002FF58499